MAWINVRDYGAVGNGVTDDTSAINQCLLENDIVVIDNGIFRISSSILVPSNTTLYLKNCEVKMLSGFIDNCIRNTDLTGNENVNIIGLGNVVINQNANDNNDGHATYGNNTSFPNAWRYVSIFLLNVTNFQLKGVMSADYMAFGIIIQKCSFGVIDNVYYMKRTTISNQDGMDIVCGSHDIDITNISGNTNDDFMAIITQVSDSAVSFSHPDYKGGDIYNINISNCNKIDRSYNTFRLITGYGYKIYNINISDITLRDTSAPLLIVGSVAYVDVPPVNADIYSIRLDNIDVNSPTGSLAPIFKLDSPCSDIIATNISNPNLLDIITTTYSPIDVWVNEIQYY